MSTGSELSRSTWKRLDSRARIRLRARWFTILWFVPLFAAPVAAGPLQDCCSDSATFCFLPFAGGAAACTAAGGTLFQANVCTSFPDCGVAHQLTVKAVVEIEVPPDPPFVERLEGTTDAFPRTVDSVQLELIQLELVGIEPLIQPLDLKQSSLQPSLGGLDPPDSFPATHFYDLFVEVELPDIPLSGHNEVPLHIEAIVDGYPEFGTPYLSSGPVPLVDDQGLPIGDILSLELRFGPEAAPLPALSHWGISAVVIVVAAVASVLLRLGRSRRRALSEVRPRRRHST